MDVMAARAQQGILTDATIVFDRDMFKIEEPSSLSDPDIRSDSELPRPMNAHAPADYQACSDRSAEGPKNLNPEGVGCPPCLEDQC
jgi:hypothetical protein